MTSSFLGAIALTAGVACMSTQATAQAAHDRTSVARAVELVADYMSRAGQEQDLALRQRMFTEGYAAQMSLPTEDDLSRVARRFKEIGEGLSAVDITPFFQRDVERDTIELNKRRYDRNRVRHLLRALLGSYADDELRRYDFKRLVDANKRDDVAALVAADENPHRQLEELCWDGKLDLAGYAAAKFTTAKWANVTAEIMAELGMVSEAERRALQYVPAADRWSPNGLAMLSRLAVTESRRGRADAVHRLVQMVLDAPNAESIAYVTAKSGWTRCEAKLWNEWPNWGARSIRWLSLPRPVFNIFPESGPSKPLADILGESSVAILAEALAGTGMSSISLKLIDRFMALIDREIVANPVAPPSKDMDEKTTNAWIARRERHQLLVNTRDSLLLARVATGGELDGDAAKVLTVKAVNWFLFRFPHSQLASRILSFSAAEQRRLDQVSPGLAAALRYDALIVQGRGQEAQALAQAQPKVREQVHEEMLQDIVASLQSARLEAKAKAMIDAYLEAHSEPDFIIVYLLLAQGRVDRAKAILRQFASSAFDSHVFIGVMLLRELGEPLDASTVKSLLRGDAAQKVDNWLAAIDALAWSAASDEIDVLLRDPPNELWALSVDDAARMRCTAYGLQAIALARGGQLEAGLRLVTERNLMQRDYGCTGDRRPFFDLRYLVQEWVERGHAQ